jgi:hypothetical protein
MLLAVLGPLGFMLMTLLPDKAPAPADLYQQFIRRQGLYLRIVYEILFFVAIWNIAYESVVVLSYFLILAEAARTGNSIAQIVDVQLASSGMWAFSEGMEECFLMVMIYLLWPLGFNLLARRRRSRISFQTGLC